MMANSCDTESDCCLNAVAVDVTDCDVTGCDVAADDDIGPMLQHINKREIVNLA